ncbi:MAG: hypothetical protein M1417_01970 [Candidatus Thermoplasmatota archaeon]|uniref:Uncharacterized protein n=1 Tax=Candidatus Sysuiplasma superficiale TaxID=2823368 RepID=A0A8J8CDE4_9ARCH|nr:hypothetical protein [Candidatus Sysuiplasma superficiale]MCL5437446.1 hypothetical protein [Candidatus Thermoplasmatota archaeon]
MHCPECRSILISIAIAFMLLGSALLLSGMPGVFNLHAEASAGTHTEQSGTVSGALSVIDDSYFGPSIQTDLFSSFNFTNSSPVVNGRFVSFVIVPVSENTSGGGYGYGFQVINFKLDQRPFSNFSSTVFSQMTFLTGSPQALSSGVSGSVFYIYSNDMLLVIHNNPEAFFQFYSFGQPVYVSITLAGGIQPSSTFPAMDNTMNAFKGLTYSNEDFTGYLLSSSSSLNISSSGVSTLLRPSSSISSLQVASGLNSLDSAMVLLAQGLAKNTVSYFASASSVSGEYALEADYQTYGQSFVMSHLGHDLLSLTSNGFKRTNGTTEVFLLSNSILGASSRNAAIYLNGMQLRRQLPLSSIVMSSGPRHSSYNITDVGGYYIVAVYSALPVSSLNISVLSGGPSLDYYLVTIAVPLIVSSAVILAAAMVLYRRKSRGNN